MPWLPQVQAQAPNRGLLALPIEVDENVHAAPSHDSQQEATKMVEVRWAAVGRRWPGTGWLWAGLHARAAPAAPPGKHWAITPGAAPSHPRPTLCQAICAPLLAALDARLNHLGCLPL